MPGTGRVTGPMVPGWWWWGGGRVTYGAGGLQLIERAGHDCVYGGVYVVQQRGGVAVL
jgi:hypothetical protein